MPIAFIPRVLTETHIPAIAEMYIASFNEAARANKTSKIANAQDEKNQKDRVIAEWNQNFIDIDARAAAARAKKEENKESLKGYFNFQNSTVMKGFVWYGPCRTWPGESGNMGEIYALYMDPTEWDGAESIVEIMTGDFRRHGYSQFLLHKPHSDPRAKKFYERMYNNANDRRTMPPNDGGMVSRYIYNL